MSWLFSTLLSLFCLPELGKFASQDKSESMIGKTSRYLFASIFFIAAVSGCASLPRTGAIAPPPPEAEAKLKEANITLDAVKEEFGAFYAEQAPVLREIEDLQGRPGWNEFESILLGQPSLRDPDNEAKITPDIASELSRWGLKWRTPWEKTLQDYHDLVDKCTLLEAKKLAVRSKLIAVQAKYLVAVMMEVSAGREKEGREIFSVVEALDKSNAELDSHRMGDLGLYGTGGRDSIPKSSIPNKPSPNPTLPPGT